MSFQKFKNISYCVGCSHHSPTTKVYGDIISKCCKGIIGYRSMCNRKKSIPVSENTIQAEGLGSFFKNLARISAKAGNKLATNVSKYPGREVEIYSNIATSAANRKSKNALTLLPELIKFYHKGKGWYLGKFCIILMIVKQSWKHSCFFTI